MDTKEKTILDLLSQAYNEFIQLPVQHEAEQQIFCNAIHQAQLVVMARDARRINPELFGFKGSEMYPQPKETFTHGCNIIEIKDQETGRVEKVMGTLKETRIKPVYWVIWAKANDRLEQMSHTVANDRIESLKLIWVDYERDQGTINPEVKDNAFAIVEMPSGDICFKRDDTSECGYKIRAYMKWAEDKAPVKPEFPGDRVG